MDSPESCTFLSRYQFLCNLRRLDIYATSNWRPCHKSSYTGSIHSTGPNELWQGNNNSIKQWKPIQRWQNKRNRSVLSKFSQTRAFDHAQALTASLRVVTSNCKLRTRFLLWQLVGWQSQELTVWPSPSEQSRLSPMRIWNNPDYNTAPHRQQL